LSRRGILAAGAASALAGSARAAAAAGIPIIDTHIHLFDPNRPQGAPYTGPPNSPTHATGAFPTGYARLARPLGVVGAIEVEASPWIEDNLWAVEQAAQSDIIVGRVGNLRPESGDFAELLERFRRNPLFRGIRYGNIWGYDLATQSRSRPFLDGLKRLAEADLSLDTANPNVALLEAALRISDAAPDLRIVLDHLPAFEPAHPEQAAYDAVLRGLSARPLVFAKLSEIVHRRNGAVSTDVGAYRARLDQLCETFGEDRLLFGSDWPNSDGVAPIGVVLKVARDYFAARPRAAQEKYFWRNSVRAYKWVRRSPAQPAPG
jgi:predicted TIM-barrel fold metal-dependent hydrolase